MVEAVFEQLDVKHEVFRELDRICRDGAVLASNTSAIPITPIAAVTGAPGGRRRHALLLAGADDGALRAGPRAQDQRRDAGGRPRLRRVVGKTCVVVNRDVAGFVTTRLICALAMEAIRLVESGVASAEDIDTACRLGFGHPMGPLATTDLTGVDILRHATLNIYEETADEKFFPPEILTRMVAAGDLGRKTGRGFYPYDA